MKRAARAVGKNWAPLGGAVASAVAATVAITAVGGTACSTSKPTELVPGVLTQMQVPRDLQAIRVDVQSDGRVVFCQSYVVYDGVVRLPRTLGVVSASSPSASVKVEIRGYSDPTSDDLLNCGTEPVGPADSGATSPPPRILRRSIQTFVDQHILFLPMPLSYSCWDDLGACTTTDTNGTMTCKGASCVDSHVDSAKLADFDPTLVDGTGLCFDASSCFATAVPATIVDASTCTYGLPAGFPAGLGLNVRIFYRDVTTTCDATTGVCTPQITNGAEGEILDDDPTEGFTVLPNQQFQLAPGLCALVQQAATPPAPSGSATSIHYRTVPDVQVTNACAAKSQLLPFCPPDQNSPVDLPDGGISKDGVCNVAASLSPVPSAVYLVMDDSAAMHAAFGATGYATAIGLSLGAPVFKRTSAAFTFLSHQGSECTSPTTSFTTPAVPFGLASTVQAPIATALQSWTAPGDTAAAPKPLDLQAAMRTDAGAYAAVAAFLQGKETPDVAGAMFFVNRVPDSTAATGNDCSPPVLAKADAQTAIEAETQNALTAGLRTFFVVLDNDTHTPPLDFFNQVAGALPPGAVTVLDATSADPATVLFNFSQAAVELGTCLYEAPSVPLTNAQVTFTNPLIAPIPVPADAGSDASASNPADTIVPAAPTCSAATATTVDGWAIDGGRLRICGASCDALRQLTLTVSAAAQQSNIAVPDVTVSATVPCQ